MVSCTIYNDKQTGKMIRHLVRRTIWTFYFIKDCRV